MGWIFKDFWLSGTRYSGLVRDRDAISTRFLGLKSLIIKASTRWTRFFQYFKWSCVFLGKNMCMGVGKWRKSIFGVPWRFLADFWGFLVHLLMGFWQVFVELMWKSEYIYKKSIISIKHI
jgi:hypothetical protein